MQIFLLKMFEKCGFSEENTRELLSPTDEHGLTRKQGNIISYSLRSRNLIKSFKLAKLAQGAPQ